jgi:protein SCO1
LHRIQRVPDAWILDADAQLAPLSSLVRGAVTALGFFYGHCADPAGCPVVWSVFESLKRDAEADPLLRSKLRLVFVSLDPTHDTPSVMRLLRDSENGVGAAVPWAFVTSRTDSELAPLLRAMGQEVNFEIGSDGGRTSVINHMVKVFLIDPDGWVREIYTTAFLSNDSLLNDARTLAMAHPEASNRIEAFPYTTRFLRWLGGAG